VARFTNKLMNSRKIIIGFILLVSAIQIANAQTSSTTGALNGGNTLNAITTAVPVLLISPDSRAGAMGECGVATSPDINSMHWNAAKYAFIDKKVGVAASYTPWLRKLVPDISLAYLAGYGKLDKNSAIAGSLRYFSLGTINFTDATGNPNGNYKPNEFALDLAYTRKLGEKFSAAMAFRYINSNLTGGLPLQNGTATKAGQAVAVDISGFYSNKDIKVSGNKSELTFGFNISNIGNKLSYTDNAAPEARNFLPMNLRLGSGLKLNLDDANTVAFTVDLNKLLVPTPPRYKYDAAGSIVVDGNGERVIEAGKDPYRSVASGMFGSFNDAPDGFKEEMREIIMQVGAEYWYDKLLALRAGYFHENKSKGGRQFFTLGLGVKYNVFGLDFAYLVPTVPRNNPLQNTLRFSLSFDFDAFNKQNKETTSDN
jgi:hypothetical protein